jgi:hypothetical protein
MLSWIFRNRLRLARIYGAAPPPALPGARFAARPKARLPRGADGPRPGELYRVARHVLVRPMPPRAG